MGVVLDDLVRCHDGRWSLYFVSGTKGDKRKGNEGALHFFQKLLMIPVGATGYGKARCKALGWDLVGHWNASNDTRRLPRLRSLLKGYETEDGYDRTHVHIGIHMEALSAGQGNNDKNSLRKIKQAVAASKDRIDKKKSHRKLRQAAGKGKYETKDITMKAKQAAREARTEQQPIEFRFNI